MRLNWRLLGVIGALAVVLVHCEARSDTPSFGAIDDNPDPAQARFLQHSLKTLDLANAPTLAASAKTNKRIANQSFWIARFADPSLCDHERCLTLIIEGRDQSDWHVQTMFYAGDIVSLSEPENKPFGESAIVFSSKGRDQMIIATRTQLGWLVR